MKLSSVLLTCLCGAVAILPLCAQPRTRKASSQALPPQSNQQSSPADSSPGERVFKQNCSRCHDAPQSFSPRISGTLIRHMRVRASLSERDEKQILSFLNP
jgi:cytochrome c5